MTNYFKFFLLSALSLFICHNAFAALEMELTKGIDSAIPIAVVPFGWNSYGGQPAADVSAIIASDLSMSGRFHLLEKQSMRNFPHTVKEVKLDEWRQKNIENMVVGQIVPVGNNQFKVSFSLLDLYEKASGSGNLSPVLATQEYVVKAKELRSLAHHISDIIYQKLTGERGVFSTRIAYVLVQHPYGSNPHYMLEVADMDGYNAQAIVHSSEPIMSPSWSPDGKKIAYVSFEGKRPRIFVSDLQTGRRDLISSFPGINGAPAWSPDGRKLALALSLKSTNPNIFILDLGTKHMTQITQDLSINTEPRWSPDGRTLLFTSDRGGTPQIYTVSLNTRQIERVTFVGNYNASAQFAPDARSLVLLHRGNRGFIISTLDLNSGVVTELTTQGQDEAPSFAPNGKMIVYASQYGGKGVLGMVSVDGRVKLRMPAQIGSVQEPAWSPFLN